MPGSRTYGNILNQPVPQTQPLTPDQVQNNAGGYVYQLDKFKYLDRFLVLGAEGNTYYCTEQKMVLENAKNVQACVAEDPIRTINRIVEISDAGRAPKNDPAIFALAIAASPKFNPNVAARQHALASFPKVARYSTHMFQFLEVLQSMRGWSSQVRKAVQQWYLQRSPASMATQVVKYQSRNGWTHNDVMRLAHFNQAQRNDSQKAIEHYVKRGWEDVGELPHPDQNLQIIWAFERAKRATSEKELLPLITTYRLPFECVPTQYLKSPAVWEALLPHMGLTALIRNLGRMTSIGLLQKLSEPVKLVVSKLTSPDELKQARVHPITVLSALRVYEGGRGIKGDLTWSPVAQITSALNDAFYEAFGVVESTGKNWLLALDVSGSMGGGRIAGLPNLRPVDVTGVMAMVTARKEPMGYACMGFCGTFVELGITPKQDLTTVIQKVQRNNFGSTDCSLPWLYAAQHKLPVDVVVTLTDNETYAGAMHPSVAMKQYRQQMGRQTKNIVMGLTSTGFTIADPKDPDSLDVVGCDSAVPQIMADFVTGKIQ